MWEGGREKAEGRRGRSRGPEGRGEGGRETNVDAGGVAAITAVLCPFFCRPP